MTGVPGLVRLFPSPTAIAAADAVALGPRAETVRALARGALSLTGELPGVDASAMQDIALRGLGEPDAFPAADPLLRGAAALAEAWRPWRGYAAFHLWLSAHDRVRKRPVRRAATG